MGSGAQLRVLTLIPPLGVGAWAGDVGSRACDPTEALE